MSTGAVIALDVIVGLLCFALARKWREYQRVLKDPLSERQVQDQLRPERHRHQVLAVAPASPPQVSSSPETHARPTGPENLGGARGELLSDRAGDSTG